MHLKTINTREISQTIIGLVMIGCMWCAAWGEDAPPEFFRGLNLNGPAVTIDGFDWEGQESTNYTCSDSSFDSQQIPLVPATDAQRAAMIRSSRWGGNRIELKNVPEGEYSLFLYVWEDNSPEIYSISVNGQQVQAEYHSGSTGHWEKLGPWFVQPDKGSVVVTSQGGAANFSGVELWHGRTDGFNLPISDEDLAFFEQRIRPLLVEKCYACHSADAEELAGELLVDSRGPLRRGGSRGPAVVPRDLQQSLLIEAVSFTNPELQMPPDEKLSDAEIADLERWVTLGAPDPRSSSTRHLGKQVDLAAAREFWSLRPLTAPAIPEVSNTAWVRGDVDRFVLAKLEGQQLSPSPDADKRTWLRRATYDLTGLPPTLDEVSDFLSDDSDTAHASVVDRLLASARYGERWGRHWLDVVRYADTAGDNSDFPIPQIYLYRDWVIEAFNRDLPYDEFVRDQLAGDLRGGDSDGQRNERLIATGYIANSRRFGSRVDDYPQHLTIEDTIDNVGRTFLGMTINCARCHDHKFDPITARDYYGLYGIFSSTRYPWPGIELDQQQRDFVPLVATDNLAELSGQSAKLKTAYAVVDSGSGTGVAMHIKGDPTRPGDMVERHFPAVLGGGTLPENEVGSGRAQLAEWILAEDNPLPARVMANRLWHYHFGRGIVPTPNDFGKQGKPATHPELLDYLAIQFRHSGWSIKSMHRMIMLSSTYRQASQPEAQALAQDPANQWLSSFPRQRIEAEELRDTLLFHARNLDLSAAGPHPFPPDEDRKYTQHNPFKAVYESRHRSVYLMTQRIQRHPFLAIFDGADPSASTAARTTTTTPVQALYMLNDPFFHEQARCVAERVCEGEPEMGARIAYAYELLFSRPATAKERDAAVDFLTRAEPLLRDAGTPAEELESQAWQAWVRTLFRLNEFVYLD